MSCLTDIGGCGYEFCWVWRSEPLKQNFSSWICLWAAHRTRISPVLRSWQPSEEVLKPWVGKVPRRMLRKVPAPNGARNPKHFLGTFLGTSFGASTFQSTFLGTFPAWRCGTSVDGRQGRNASALTIGDRKTTCLTLIPDELFQVIACVSV